MESIEEAKKLIGDAKNICLIPSQGTILRPASQSEPESLTAALALFYTLRELNKNVNLIIQDVPEKYNFLIPSLEFIAQPKNFVISIPRKIADVSQVYYEKNEENLKIHLTIDKGSIKKDNISFYFTDIKPDIIITLGIKDFQKELEDKLDSFGFLLDSPIINIDNHQENNEKFGKINIIEEKSFSEIILEVIKSVNQNPTSKNIADCLLTGLILHYENFQSPKATPEIFELCAQLMKRGADRQQIIENLYHKAKTEPFGATQDKAAPLPIQDKDAPLTKRDLIHNI